MFSKEMIAKDNVIWTYDRMEEAILKIEALQSGVYTAMNGDVKKADEMANELDNLKKEMQEKFDKMLTIIVNKNGFESFDDVID